MSSEQERIVKQITEHAMGVAFVFEPDEYSKGNKGRREPADLAWASHNCIILMAMTESVASREKMFKHNMNQLRGWMRIWKQGSMLTGKSMNTTYEIAFNDYRHKILISVVQGPDATAESHEELRRELAQKGIDVTACVTIPQAAMMYLTEHGGSVRDLLNFIDRVRQGNAFLTSDAAVELIKSQHQQAFSDAFAAELLPDYETDTRLKEIVRAFREVRGAADEKLVGLVQVFNDLSWVEFIHLLYTLRHFQKAIQSVPTGGKGARAMLQPLIFPPYQFVISAFAMTDSRVREYSTAMTEKYKELSDARPDLCSVLICLPLINIEGDVAPIYGVPDRTSESATERHLNSWLLGGESGQ